MSNKAKSATRCGKSMSPSRRASSPRPEKCGARRPSKAWPAAPKHDARRRRSPGRARDMAARRLILSSIFSCRRAATRRSDSGAREAREEKAQAVDWQRWYADDTYRALIREQERELLRREQERGYYQRGKERELERSGAVWPAKPPGASNIANRSGVRLAARTATSAAHERAARRTPEGPRRIAAHHHHSNATILRDCAGLVRCSCFSARRFA